MALLPLTSSSLAIGSVALVALMIVCQIVYYRFLHPLSEFPGPFWASVTRLWIAYHTLKEDELAVYLKLHEQHGKINSQKLLRAVLTMRP